MDLLSPEVDLLVRSVRRCGEVVDEELSLRVRELLGLLDKIRAVESGPDSIWRFWIRTRRGTLDDFGDYEAFKGEGEVESLEEFEELWLDEYPDELQWHRASFVKVRERLHVLFKGRELFGVEGKTFFDADVSHDETRNLVEWLLMEVIGEAREFIAAPESYNRRIARDLPLSRRYGRILRRDVWAVSEDVVRFDRELGEENIVKLEGVVQGPEEVSFPRMTLACYLDYCRLCYEANDYESIEQGSSQRAMYRAMADNRDEGLLDLPPDDAEAFSRWYRERFGGGHPWEICRGGNTTHISLSVVGLDEGWQLWLEGFSAARLVETARMAIALHEHAVPFVLAHGEDMLHMLRGTDSIGIVPGDLPLGYNHDDFPDEDRVFSFAHLWMIDEIDESLRVKIFWYPLEGLEAGGSDV